MPIDDADQKIINFKEVTKITLFMDLIMLFLFYKDTKTHEHESIIKSKVI